MRESFAFPLSCIERRPKVPNLDAPVLEGYGDRELVDLCGLEYSVSGNRIAQ